MSALFRHEFTLTYFFALKNMGETIIGNIEEEKRGGVRGLFRRLRGKN